MAESGDISYSTLTRRVLQSMGLFGSVEVLSMACAVVRTKLLAIFVGAAGIGLLGLYTTVVELLSSLMQLGMRTTAVREISSASPAQQSRIIATVSKLGTSLAITGILVTALLSPALSRISFGDWGHMADFVVLGVCIGAGVLVAARSAIMQSLGKLRSIAKASAWASVLSLCITVPLVIFFGQRSIIPLLVSYSLIMLASYLIAGRLRTNMPKIRVREALRQSGPMLRLGAYITVSSSVTWLTSYIIMSWLNHEGGEAEMGLYQAGYTLSVKYVGIVFTAMSLEYFPRLTESLSSGLGRGLTILRHETLLSVAVTVAIASLMIAFAPWIVRLLYSESFLPIVPMVILAAPGVVLRAISWAMAYAILAQGRGKMFMMTEICSCAINLGCMYAGYRLYGIAGIGASFTVWYFLYTLLISYLTSRRLKLPAGRKVNAWAAVATSATLILSAVALTCPAGITVIACGLTAVAALMCLRPRRHKCLR